MDPIQVSTIESAILNNLLSGDTCKFIEVVKPLGLTDYTGANLFGDSKIDALLNDAMKKIEDGESCDAACTDLMTYVQSANDPTTVNASMVKDLNNKVSKMSESLSKLTNIISNFSIDGSSKEFQDGKELAKSEPGKSKDELDIVCSKKGLDGQDAANFKFGYNSVDKKAPNIGSGESKIDQNRSEFSFKDLKQKYASVWNKVMAIGSMLDSINTSSSDEAKSKSEAEALEKLKKLVSDPKDWSEIAYNVLGLSVSPNEYNVFSEVKNMSKDDKVKDAVKGKVTGTYKWSKDGSTLAVIGVSEDEFKTWKGLVKDVLGDEITVIGVKDSKDLPSNIQFCDESTNIEYNEDPNKYYSDTITDNKKKGDVKPELDNSEFASIPSSDGIPSGTDKAVDKEMKKEMKSMIPNVNSSEGDAIEKLTEIAEIHNDKIKSMSESVTKLDPENLMIAISKLTDIVTKNTNDIKTMSDKIAKFCESADNDKKVAEVTDKKDKPTTEPEAVNHSFSITNASSADRYQSLKSLFTED